MGRDFWWIVPGFFFTSPSNCCAPTNLQIPAMHRNLSPEIGSEWEIGALCDWRLLEKLAISTFALFTSPFHDLITACKFADTRLLVSIIPFTNNGDQVQGWKIVKWLICIISRKVANEIVLSLPRTRSRGRSGGHLATFLFIYFGC